VETATAIEEHAHPAPREYVKVAIILAIVTALEIGAYYLEVFTGVPDEFLVVSLTVMMLVKFFYVAMWFMHLKFDAPIFRQLFVTGIVIALAIYAVVLILFGIRLAL
jgi:cytochrome c oxidase subunit IV